jgi:DNA-directed RNA polymerase subunit M/transcription elongation factor TFIIS
MEPLVNPARRCPKCGSSDYVFRGRKNVSAEAGPAVTAETTYRCKACGNAWKERIALFARDA